MAGLFFLVVLPMHCTPNAYAVRSVRKAYDAPIMEALVTPWGPRSHRAQCSHPETATAGEGSRVHLATRTCVEFTPNGILQSPRCNRGSFRMTEREIRGTALLQAAQKNGLGLSERPQGPFSGGLDTGGWTNG